MTFPLSDHFNGRTFFNPDGPQTKGLWDVIRWQFTRRPRPWPPKLPSAVQPAPPTRVMGGEPRITVIGHSTVLIQVHGLNFLTDPIWSERASPVQFLGPRRRRQPALRMQDLPPIDVILLSHNHYDHLDRTTLRELIDRHRPRIITTLGVSRHLPPGDGTAACLEMDWWQSEQITSDMRLTCVPAKHFSARTPFDRNRTLWCGFVLSTPSGGIYYAGDTAWGAHFEQIRERLGAPLIALLPIGAYAPRWFMSPVHMDPEEAVQAHRVLKARKSIAIHCGTFALADEGPDDPVTDLQKELTRDPPAHPFLA